MPLNPLDMLKRAGSWATTPLVSQEQVAPMQDAIDSPSLNRSPVEAALRGFLAGGLGGAATQTSPLDIAGMGAMGAAPAMRALKSLGNAGRGMSGMMGEAGFVGRGLGKADDGVSMGRQAFDIVEPRAIEQVNPGMGEVDDLLNQMHNNLAKVPNRGQAPSAPRPSMRAPQTPPRFAPPEMVQPGAEAAYNTNAAGAINGGRMATDAYSNLMNRFGGGRR